MTSRFILKKDHLMPFLRKLSKEYLIIAPEKNKHGDTLFSPVESIDSHSISLEEQPLNSVKQFFLPQQETLYTYKNPKSADYTFEKPGKSFPPTVFFGVRPCDLSALLYMDVIFLKDQRDPFYLQRRQNAVIIGLNCNNPTGNCFCNATKSGPFIDFGYDIQLTDLKDRFLVEADRSRGRDIIDKLQQFFHPAEDKDVHAQYQTFLEARGSYSLQVHVDQAVKRLQESPLPEEVWTELSERCQDCGGCAYVCPTCTCFTIFDRPLSDADGERIRVWDACTFAGFTRMAGDHNPVNHETRAIQQRFLHKFFYDVNQHGRPSCVGCGRCVDMCFGGTDVVRFINMACEGV